MTEEQERAHACGVAASYVGTPYHNNARIKGVGVDCATLLIGIFHDADLIEDYDPGAYSPQFYLHSKGPELYLEHLLKFAHEVDAPLPADVAMFRVGRKWAHGAFVMAWPRVVHAYKPDGIVRFADADKAEFADTEKYPRRFYRLNRWK